MKRILWLITSTMLFLQILSCSTDSVNASEQKSGDEATFTNPQITKWFNNKTAVTCVTYDNSLLLNENNQKVINFMDSLQMPISFEGLTEVIIDYYALRQYMLNVLMKNKLYSWFGHGHTHIDHDTISYYQAYQSFKTCYDIMSGMGLKPVAYAYPQGKGQKYLTQLACKTAGFLSARNAVFLKTREENFIMPDSINEPANWFLLPTLMMWDYSVDTDPRGIHSAAELVPYLDEAITKKAWINQMWHNIGDSTGWGWSKYSEFRKCMLEIQKRDFWVASMSDVTLYVQEKNKTNIDIDYVRDSNDQVYKIEIKLTDNLSNDIYDHPLTVGIEIPARWLGSTMSVKQNGELLSQQNCTSKQLYVNLLPNEDIYTLSLQ